MLDDDILAKVAAIKADKQARDMTGNSVQMLASLHRTSPHPDFVLNKSKGRTEECCTQIHRCNPSHVRDTRPVLGAAGGDGEAGRPGEEGGGGGVAADQPGGGAVHRGGGGWRVSEVGSTILDIFI